MKPENQNEKKPGRKKRRNSGLILTLVSICLIIGIFFFIATRQGDNSGSSGLEGQQNSIWRKITESITGTSDRTQEKTTTQKALESSDGGDTIHTNGVPQSPQKNDNTSLPADNRQPPLDNMSKQGVQPKGDTLQTVLSGTTDSCQEASKKVNAFYTHLDNQPYIKDFHLGKSSSVYFSELIQKLLDNPPVISRETDDLFTVLKNTAHFYRIIGKKNIIILKTILDKEKPYIENTLADFYVLTNYPDCLQKTFSLRVPPYSIYDYAGFFLNTMGGRLYLFRRDSVSRMTVSYYGILIVDKANRESNNRDGIQIKQAINSLITEIENSGNQLLLKDRYLDKLYELKEKNQ